MVGVEEEEDWVAITLLSAVEVTDFRLMVRQLISKILHKPSMVNKENRA